MRAALRGCPSCALLRPRAAGPSSVPAWPALPLRAAVASSSTSSQPPSAASGKKRRGGANSRGHGGWDRRESFWNKWESRSQQQFWQEVALEEDKRSEAWRSPIKSKVSLDERALALERDDYDFDFLPELNDQALGVDQVLDLGRSLGVAADADYDYDDEPSAPSAEQLQARRRSAAEGLRDELYASSEVDARRRAELLALVDELGPAAFEFPLKDDGAEREAKRAALASEAEEDIALQRQKKLATIAMSPGFYDSLKLRESGRLKQGEFFAYVLHTRMVTKVLSGGKRRSHSVLAVVGNGEGTAGFALGKDLEPSHALVKAVHNAKKSLVHVERFDGRTLFHEHEETFIKTKIVLNLRRANSGTRCNWLMWKVLSAFGISDVSVKVHGSRNNISQTHAIFNALQRMQTAQSVASRRGKRVLDMTPRSQRGRAGYESDAGYVAD